MEQELLCIGETRFLDMHKDLLSHLIVIGMERSRADISIRIVQKKA